MNIALPQFLVLACVAVAGFLMFFIAIALEWNLSLEDPDMSLPYMLWAMTVVVMTTWFAEEMKPLVALSGLALIVTGVNRLSRRELLFFASYGLIFYVASVAIKAQAEPISWMEEALAMTAFALVLVFGPIFYRVEMSMLESLLVDKNQELASALEEIKRLSVRDDLTGAFNQSYLMQVLQQQKAIADRRADYNFSLCYVDLDNFQGVNDRFGEIAGDSALVRFTSAAKQELREVDCVARIRGEEFIVVLGGTPQNEAVVAAQRLASALEEMQVSQVEPGYRITASMGIAEYRPAEEVESIVDRADRALYDAKRTGRNRIVLADPVPTYLAGHA
jgi:diguanylate cyclase (GGDEF)-like protein